MTTTNPLARYLIRALVLALKVWVIWMLWPFVMVPLFNAPLFTYWQCLMLRLLVAQFFPINLQTDDTKEQNAQTPGEALSYRQGES